MAIFKKYKQITKIIRSIEDYSLFKVRLLKFKRSKWVIVKKLIQKKNRRVKFFNYHKKRVRKGYWFKTKFSYKFGLFFSRFFKLYYGKFFNNKYFKKILLDKKKYLCKFLIKPLFKLDVLLWKLNYFSSIRESQQNLKNKKIFLNTKFVVESCFLKKGDIIQIKSLNFFKDLKKPTIKNNFFLSFCEIDYYTGTIVILKDFNTFSIKDFALIFKDNINFNSFIYYLLKK